MTFSNKKANIRTASKAKLLLPIFSFYLSWTNLGCQTLGLTDSKVDQVSRSFQNIEEFKSWFVFYYKDPKPTELTSAMLFMEKNGLLMEYPEVASMFISQIFIAHPESTSQWLNDWDKIFSERQWTVIIVALWLAERPEFNKMAITLLRHIPPAKSKKIADMLNKSSARSLNPLYADILHIGQLNMLWAGFSATGDKQYVDRVIGLVSGFAGPTPIQKKSIGKAALVSLAQNTLMDPYVAETVKQAEKSHPDPTTRALIQAMLEALATLNKQERLTPQAPAH